MTTTPATSFPEEIHFTPTPFFKKSSNYVKITLVVAAVLLAGAAVFACFIGIGTVGTILLGSGSLITLTSCIVFHFLHKSQQQKQLDNDLLDQFSQSNSTVSPEKVQTAIAKGAKVDTKDAKGFTLLHRAAEAGNLDLCKILVNGGAKPDEMNDVEGSLMSYPIDVAIKGDNLAIVEFLFEKLPKDGQDWTGRNWIKHILSEAVLYRAEKVFEKFMQAKEGRPTLDESQFGGILWTVVMCYCSSCTLYNKNEKELAILLKFVALLKNQNALLKKAQEYLQKQKTEAIDTVLITKVEFLQRLQLLETALTG